MCLQLKTVDMANITLVKVLKFNTWHKHAFKHLLQQIILQIKRQIKLLDNEQILFENDQYILATNSIMRGSRVNGPGPMRFALLAFKQ